MNRTIEHSLLSLNAVDLQLHIHPFLANDLDMLSETQPAFLSQAVDLLRKDGVGSLTDSKIMLMFLWAFLLGT